MSHRVESQPLSANTGQAPCEWGLLPKRLSGPTKVRAPLMLLSLSLSASELMQLETRLCPSAMHSLKCLDYVAVLVWDPIRSITQKDASKLWHEKKIQERLCTPLYPYFSRIPQKLGSHCAASILRCLHLQNGKGDRIHSNLLPPGPATLQGNGRACLVQSHHKDTCWSGAPDEPYGQRENTHFIGPTTHNPWRSFPQGAEILWIPKEEVSGPA